MNKVSLFLFYVQPLENLECQRVHCSEEFLGFEQCDAELSVPGLQLLREVQYVLRGLPRPKMLFFIWPREVLHGHVSAKRGEHFKAVAVSSCPKVIPDVVFVRVNSDVRVQVLV